jgi:hypothetical protein
MLVHVRRPRDHDCTNGGISKNHDTLLVVESDAAAPADATLPVMVLEQHAPGAVCLRPVEGLWPKNEVGPMLGGNYAVGDAKFDEAVEKLLGTKFYGAVAIHDRFESQKISDFLGR